MEQFVQIMYDGYRDLMDNKSDPRVKDWFLMSSPFPTLVICLCYAYFSKVLGPKLMENKKPFVLKKTMIWYNFAQVIISTWLFSESLASGWAGEYSFRCQPVDYSLNPQALRMARGSWYYYMSKFIEFSDTIFFVLRKKYDHISKLHVIHHGIMPLSVWFGVKFTPGIPCIFLNRQYVSYSCMSLIDIANSVHFFGLLNTFVHIVMYTYYLLAALGPSIQPYLWWKRYLTTLQMIQFILVMVHAFQLLFIDCDYPKAFVWWIGFHAILFYFLFRQFYNETYNKKSQKKVTINVTERKEKQLHELNNKHENQKNRNGSVYPSQCKMATAYISDSGFRNRVFIDNRNSYEE